MPMEIRLTTWILCQGSKLNSTHEAAPGNDGSSEAAFSVLRLERIEFMLAKEVHLSGLTDK